MKTLHPTALSRPLASIGILLAAVFALLLVGCGRDKSESDTGTIKVAYLGLTCEAPIFVAYEKSMFKEEGIDVELVRTDWEGLREGLANGHFHANHTLVMYLLKGIEKSADMMITAGVHTGCLRVQVGIGSEIKSVAELRGKKIGVPTHFNSPPHMFASRVLAAAGIDPSPEAKQIEWMVFPPDQLGPAVGDGRVDAVATADPIGTILEGQKLVRTIADQAKDLPYAEEYCCAVVVNGELVRKHPLVAAKVTRAILKGAKWVHENPRAAAEMGVEKNYVTASVEINTQALAMLKYTPGVTKGKQSIELVASDMKRAKLLNESTDPVALAKRAWVDLEGVTDEWVVAQNVERIRGGGRPAVLPAERFAALFDRKACCACCCIATID